MKWSKKQMDHSLMIHDLLTIDELIAYNFITVEDGYVGHPWVGHIPCLEGPQIK